jgi:transglutaminase-like putative cysteine protease
MSSSGFGHRLRLSILALWLFGWMGAWAVSDRDAGIVRGSDQFEFTYRVKIPALSGPARLWIPLASSDDFQTVELEAIQTALPHQEIHDRVYGNKILFLTASPAESGKTVEVNYRVKRKEKSSYDDLERDWNRYLRAERLVPVNETFRSLAAAATRGKKTGLERGRALYDHVLKRMRYDKTGIGWGRGDAVYACDARAGNCSDFHAYFIALARAIGIPARFAIGATIPSDHDEGQIAGYHCWAEFLADGKWVPVDISEAWKKPALADYYFGHHPANRFELSKGRDLIVTPEPATGPLNFLAYPHLELDGKETKAETEFSYKRKNG